jgi:hypothetical protein
MVAGIQQGGVPFCDTPDRVAGCPQAGLALWITSAVKMGGLSNIPAHLLLSHPVIK